MAWLSCGSSVALIEGLVKGPVLRAPYGGSYMSLCDGLVDALEEHIDCVPLERYTLEISIPSKYMASILWKEMKAVIAPVLEVKAWLRDSCRKVLGKGMAMEWTSPSGWPMRVADREPTTRKIFTNLYGKRVGMNIADQPMDSPLSATQANKALAANAVHSFDAAFAQIIAYRAAVQELPLLANHDCFACHPANAAKAAPDAARGVRCHAPGAPVDPDAGRDPGQDRGSSSRPRPSSSPWIPRDSAKIRICSLRGGCFSTTASYGSGAHNQYAKWQKS